MLQKWVILVFLAITGCFSQTDDCDYDNFIIPYETLDQAFDQGIDAVRSQEDLVTLIETPNIDNVRNYLFSLAPFSAPLFAMAVLAFIFFIASIVQVICFNTCSKECCGNEINSSTYNVCCLRTMVVSFILLSFLILGISIAAMILNSDLQMAIDSTSCNTKNVILETYNGNSNETIPWSGINSFQNDIDIFAINIQNAIPTLITYFSTSNTAYENVVDDTSGSLYSNSQVFVANCQESAITVDCPFPDSATCTRPYDPTFNKQFCNATFEGSAANLITEEMSTNSTTWRQNIIEVGTTLTTLDTESTEVNTLVNQVTDFTTSVGNYEQDLLDGFGQAETINNSIEIAFYVFYAFVMACALLGLTVVCCVYYCNSFKCRYFMYFLWYAYAILSIIFFVGAGLFFAASIFTYDTCTAYPYYFQNQTNFNSLTFGSSELQDIFQACFYTNATSIFVAFTDTSILSQFGELKTQYDLATPSDSFTTVVTSIEHQMNVYRQNPNTVTIFDVPDDEQPSVAMAQLEQFGNFSDPDTTQSCRLTRDFFTFDIANCYPYLVNQPVSSNCCVVLYANNISDIVTDRVSEFDSRNCTTDGDTYELRVNAMVAYGDSITSMVQEIAPISGTTALKTYEDNYFAYYVEVLNFMNNQVDNDFQSFFDPYLSLQEGSSCGFVTASMNAIVDIACNELFPYVNAFSALNIVSSAFIFILFILSYFLTTRFQFYEFLEGNYANYGVETKTTGQLHQPYDFDTTGRNIEMLPNTNRIY